MSVEHISDAMVKQFYHTHDWTTDEMPICRRCGMSPIGLGMWGDQNWRKTHRGWENPCRGEDEDSRL